MENPIYKSIVQNIARDTNTKEKNLKSHYHISR